MYDGRGQCPTQTLTECGCMAPVSDLSSVEQIPHGRTAQRLEWQHLPPAVRRFVEGRLGSQVVRAESQGGGFTPGFASRLTGEDGSRIFVKAANKQAQKQFAEAYAEEVHNLRLLPGGLPVPRLLWSHEDERWIVVGFECVEGSQPRRPWRATQLDACLDSLEVIADALTPAPPSFGLSPIAEEIPALVTGWDHVRAKDPDWPHLAEAATLAARLPSLEDRVGFVHADARDDNFVMAGDGTALLCDWNWPALGPVWLDAVDLMMTAHGDGLDADALVARRALTKDVDPEHIDVWLAALCGFMLVCRDRPVPPTSPYLRVHNRWWSEAAWSWLAHRRGWT